MKTVFEGSETFRCQPQISAVGKRNIAITGAGIIDGAGDIWRLGRKAEMPPSVWQQHVQSGGILSEDGEQWYPSESYYRGAKDATQNIVPWAKTMADFESIRDFLRPVMIHIRGCEGVLLEGVTFQNSPCWNVHLALCRNLVVDGIVVDDKLKVPFVLLLLFVVQNLCETLFPGAEFAGVSPCVLDGREPGQASQLVRVGGVIVKYHLGGVGDEHIYADLSFRLITVGREPSQLVEVVNHIEVVVVGRVEREAHIVRLQIAAVLCVIPSDEDVVSSQILTSFRGEVERHSVRVHERIVLVSAHIFQSLQWSRVLPSVGEADA